MSGKQQTTYWLAALHTPDVGPQTVLSLLEQVGSIEHVCQTLQQPNWAQVEKDLAWAEDPQHHIITLTDPDYPDRLKEIHAPPLVLFVAGDKSALKHEQIAMVGSRHPSPSGLRDAEEFAYQLVAAGFAITSGLALGVDGACHRGALRAKGITIGVMGTGLNHLYPATHRMLAKDILNNGGALVSEFPLDTRPIPQNFPRRNRIISGMSKGTLVVEAAIKSGSLITARYASEQGREVFAIPGSIHHGLARGCHYLIQQGATLVESPEDIVNELALSLPATPKQKPKRKTSRSAPSQSPLLAPEETQLLDQIEYATTPMDVIILRSGLTAAAVSSILLSLELQGHIQSVPGGYIRAVAN